MNRVNQDAMILVKRLKSDINASQALLPTMENPWLLGTDQARRYEKNEEGEWEYIPGIVLGIQE